MGTLTLPGSTLASAIPPLCLLLPQGSSRASCRTPPTTPGTPCSSTLTSPLRPVSCSLSYLLHRPLSSLTSLPSSLRLLAFSLWLIYYIILLLNGQQGTKIMKIIVLGTTRPESFWQPRKVFWQPRKVFCYVRKVFCHVRKVFCWQRKVFCYVRKGFLSSDKFTQGLQYNFMGQKGNKKVTYLANHVEY